MIQNSQVDFEETGVDPHTLDELRSVCRPYFAIPAKCRKYCHKPYSCSYTFFCPESALVALFDIHLIFRSLSVGSLLVRRQHPNWAIFTSEKWAGGRAAFGGGPVVRSYFIPPPVLRLIKFVRFCWLAYVVTPHTFIRLCITYSSPLGIY